MSASREDVLAVSPELISSMPRRRFVPFGRSPEVDSLGFFDPGAPDSSLAVSELFDSRAVFVTAPPWTGKTFVARQLEHYFRRESHCDPGGEPTAIHGHVLLLDQYPSGYRLLPPWWDEWRNGDGRAVLIVDSVDEDCRKQENRVLHVLGEIESLRAAARSRLSLVLFCRDTEQPPRVMERLQGIYSGAESAELLRVQLAPMTAADAREHVGGHSEFEKVRGIIAANNLESISSFPAVLDYLKSLPGDSRLRTVDVWRGVLTTLCRDRRDGFQPAALRDEHLLGAAARIASVLTLSGHREVSDGLNASQGLELVQLFPLNEHGDDLSIRAAKEVIRSTAFWHTGSGYRIRQSHVQEWLTTFGLAPLPLLRLKPLLTTETGQPCGAYRGLMKPLYDATDHEDVRNWILEQHEGVLPRSDVAPWTFEQAVTVLDRLQELSKRGQWPLLFSRESDLAVVQAPGLGAILANRLVDPRLATQEKELIIDIAGATSEKGVLPVARQLVKDTGQQPHLRESAAILVARVGERADLLELGNWIKSSSESSPAFHRLTSLLLCPLFDKGIWDFQTVVKHAPPEEEGIWPGLGWLWHRLEEAMSLEHARWVLSEVKPGRHCVAMPHRPRPGVMQLYRKAIAIFCEQECFTGADIDLLVSLAMGCSGTDHVFSSDRLYEAIATSLAARQRLYSAGLEQNQSLPPARLHRWRYVLNPEDLDWLISLAEQRGVSSPWLWEDVLGLAYATEVTLARRRRAIARARVAQPETVARFQKGRKRYLAEMKQQEQREQQRQVSQHRQAFALKELVEDVLNHPEIGLHDRLLRLSWFCFGDSATRPTNVTGAFSALDAPLQERIRAICKQALAESSPTEIPEATRYSADILHEANCFAEAVLEPAWQYVPTPGDIQRWLQSLLVFSVDRQEAVLAQCVSSDAASTEEVVLREARRQAKTTPDFVSAIANFPARLWSDRLAAHVASMCRDISLDERARVALLDALALQAPSLAAPVADGWAQLASGPEKSTDKQAVAGLDVLLALEPEVAWPRLKRQLEEQGTPLWPRLKRLYSHRSRRGGWQGKWPAQLLAELCQLLSDAYPVANDPQIVPGEVYPVTPDTELRELRSQIPRLLLSRGREEDARALQGLAARIDWVRRWLDQEQANQLAQGLLARITPSVATDPSSPHLSPQVVVSALEDNRRRFIRSPDDLQSVLLEQLRLIGQDCREHVHMLYTPRQGASEQKRLGEDALQAYIKCRLEDRLRGPVLDQRTEIIMNREPLASGNQRYDIKVQSPTVADSVATVIIEIKWSDNVTISTSLYEQLGEEYLVRPCLTHGIYLVGWCCPGTWSRRAEGTSPSPRDSLEAWRRSIVSQAEAFSQRHPQIHIAPFVLDLTWPSAQEASPPNAVVPAHGATVSNI